MLAGDLALTAWMDSVLGTSSISDVRFEVTSTSYGRSHSGSPASCCPAIHKDHDGRREAD